MRHRKVVLSAISFATIAVALACVDTPTGPPRAAQERIVGGLAFQAMYLADDAGRLSLAGTATTPATGKGPPTVDMVTDTARAAALAKRLTRGPTGGAMLSVGSKDSKGPRFKGKAYTKVVNGKRVDFIVLPDPDRAAHRPPRGYVTAFPGRW